MKKFSFILLLLVSVIAHGQILTISNNPPKYQTGNPSTIVVRYTVTLGTGNWDITPTCTGCFGVANPLVATNINGNGGFADITFTTPNPAGPNLVFGGSARKGMETINALTQTTLDIELLTFEAQQEDGGVILIWKVATETDNDFMAIERSNDGQTFVEVGQVKGRGTTLIPYTYNYVDYSASEGVNYYRLRQVDFDKSVQYSKIIAVNAPGSNDIFAFPNPTKDKLYIQYDRSKGEGNVYLYDALGRRVNASISGTAGTYELNLPGDSPKGTYWLKVERAGKVQTVPVVKE